MKHYFIQRDHIIKSIHEIKNSGVPVGKSTKKYLVEYQNNFYPPSYLISLANQHAGGSSSNLSQFEGEEEINTLLSELGFTVIDLCTLDTKTLENLNNQRIISLTKIHSNENCFKCKKIIKGILENIYGATEIDYSANLGTKPEDFINFKHYDKLNNIYELIQNYGGFSEFVTTTSLPACDFYILDHGRIIEFDESPHFNPLRRMTLENYPLDVKLDFEKEKWLRLCEKKSREDYNITDKDKQRAWFDTLKDFIPSMDIQEPRPLNNITRLYTSDFIWCSLNPDEFSKKKDSE